MKSVDREFAIIAALVLALAVYLLGTSSLGPGLAVIAFLLGSLFAQHRLGKGASRNTRIAAGLFSTSVIWSFGHYFIATPPTLWMYTGMEFAIALAATFWLVIRPGWFPAAIIAVDSFMGMVAALRSLVWIMSDEVAFPGTLVFQILATLVLRFAVIGFLLRALTEGFGKPQAAEPDIGEVFD